MNSYAIELSIIMYLCRYLAELFGKFTLFTVFYLCEKIHRYIVSGVIMDFSDWCYDPKSSTTGQNHQSVNNLKVCRTVYVCVTYFSYCCIQMPGKEQLEEGRGYFALHFEERKAWQKVTLNGGYMHIGHLTSTYLGQLGSREWTGSSGYKTSMPKSSDHFLQQGSAS